MINSLIMMLTCHTQESPQENTTPKIGSIKHFQGIIWSDFAQALTQHTSPGRLMKEVVPADLYNYSLHQTSHKRQLSIFINMPTSTDSFQIFIGYIQSH